MAATRLPVEVELAYEVMPCNALRTSQEPLGPPHPCTYFRRWGTYHGYDYEEAGPPQKPGIVQPAEYVGRVPLVPELLSGCRKAPILAVGINPNLPGWWPFNRNALNPLFDETKQYAHYFRYRAMDKLALRPKDYERYRRGRADGPFSGLVLDVPANAQGKQEIRVTPVRQKMYQGYQRLLDELADAMRWPGHELSVGEDLAYGNMVACPSAKWTTVKIPEDPELPPMTRAERNGIVTECFHKRRYFLRQLFQSLPAVILAFSQNTANALIGELEGRFTAGDPKPGEPVKELMKREIRLRYGEAAAVGPIEARVIFAPHITGDPRAFGPARARVVEQLVEEARAGRLRYNEATKHLARGRGGCVFCPMLEIGPCDYADELEPLSEVPRLLAAGPAAEFQAERQAQEALLQSAGLGGGEPSPAWDRADERRPGSRSSEGLS